MLAEFSIDQITDDRECFVAHEATAAFPVVPDATVIMPDGGAKGDTDKKLEPDTELDGEFGLLEDPDLAVADERVAWPDDEALFAEEDTAAKPNANTLAVARRNVEAALGNSDGTEATAGEAAAAETERETAVDPRGVEGGGPPDNPGGTSEVSGDDDGNLPKRVRRDEREIPEDKRERITEIGKAHIHHEIQDDGVQVLSLPGGNRSSYQISESEGRWTAVNWRIDINKEQRDLGIGRRLAKETADELIRQGVDTLDFDIESEAALRTAFTVFDHHISYTAPDGSEISTPQQALAMIERSRSETAESPSGIHASVDIHSFFARDAAYHTTDGEHIIDRCDFSNAQADEHGMYGEVHAFRQRLLGLPEPHATNATLAFNELLANYKAHVLPVNAGERYEIRTSWVQDPDTRQSHIRLTNYFFGSVRPGLVDEINYHFSEIGSEEAFYGESREAQGAEVDPEDVEAANTLAERGEETTAHLQQSGRGLATIKRVCTRAMAVGFPGGGGGFILDIKDVEVARKPAKPETQTPASKDEVDSLIDDYLKDFPDE